MMLVVRCYDFQRDLFVMSFDAPNEDVARREFSSWYNMVIRPSRWETRTFGRYYLFVMGVRLPDGSEDLYQRPKIIMEDDEVRLSYAHFRACDPPANAAEEAELEADFDRMDAVDAARLARRVNTAA